jgi:hypothetical protein
MRSIFETFWDCIPKEVSIEGAQDIGEHEGNVTGQWFEKYGGQCGECISGSNSEARDGAIGEDKDRSDRLGVIWI